MTVFTLMNYSWGGGGALDQETGEPVVNVAKPSTHQALIDLFPFAKIRPGQYPMLQVVADSLDAKTRFTCIEAPTGCGKSPIGIAAARYAGDGKAYILTSQNILSDQMLRDFGHLGLVTVKGKSNYQCHLPRNGKYVDCEIGSKQNGGSVCDECPYKENKQRFIDRSLGITNYHYFLTEARFVRQLESRDTLVLDEAHNIESDVLAMANIEITPERCGDFDLILPVFTNQQDIVQWLASRLRPAALRKMDELTAEIALQDAFLAEMELLDPRRPRLEVTISAFHKKQNLVDNLIHKVNNYIEDVADNQHNWMGWSDKKSNVLNIRPYSAAPFCRQLLYRKHRTILLMSATMLDHRAMMRSIGIEPAEARYFAAPSEFPVANRPIFYWPAGNMGSKTIEEALPRLLRRIEEILDRHPNEKGLIHTHNYKICGQVVQHLLRTKHGWRVLTHTHSDARDLALQQHLNTREPSVLITPGMAEGVDLKDDLSRFQIVSKIPFPMLDDYVRERMKRDHDWYNMRTAVTLVQACGRSIRTEEDYAVTYIIDEGFRSFEQWSGHLLPDWWKEAVHRVKKIY